MFYALEHHVKLQTIQPALNFFPSSGKRLDKLVFLLVPQGQQTGWYIQNSGYLF